MLSICISLPLKHRVMILLLLLCAIGDVLLSLQGLSSNMI